MAPHWLAWLTCQYIPCKAPNCNSICCPCGSKAQAESTLYVQAEEVSKLGSKSVEGKAEVIHNDYISTASSDTTKSQCHQLSSSTSDGGSYGRDPIERKMRDKFKAVKKKAKGQTFTQPVQKEQDIDESDLLNQSLVTDFRKGTPEAMNHFKHRQLATSETELRALQEESVRVHLSLQGRGNKEISVVGIIGSGKTTLCKALDSIQEKLQGLKFKEQRGINPRDKYMQNYFVDNSLASSKAIIIVLGDEVSDVEAEIALHCQKAQLPFLCVRSRSDTLLASLNEKFTPAKIAAEAFRGSKGESHSLSEQVYKGYKSYKAQMGAKLEQKFRSVGVTTFDMNKQFFIICPMALTHTPQENKAIPLDEEALIIALRRLS